MRGAPGGTCGGRRGGQDEEVRRKGNVTGSSGATANSSVAIEQVSTAAAASPTIAPIPTMPVVEA